MVNELCDFYRNIAQRLVYRDGKRISTLYKNNINNINHINNIISDMGFSHILVKKDNFEYNIFYEKGTVFDVIYDLFNRFDSYRSIKSMFGRRMPLFSEQEIRACLCMAVCIMWELRAFEVTKDLYTIDSIYQYNDIFIPYILNDTELHKDEEFFYDLVEYLFKYFYVFDSPVEYISFGECHNRYGLKLKNKDCMLSDFVDILINSGVVPLMYKRDFHSMESFKECLKFTHCILSGLEKKP